MSETKVIVSVLILVALVCSLVGMLYGMAGPAWIGGIAVGGLATFPARS